VYEILRPHESTKTSDKSAIPLHVVGVDRGLSNKVEGDIYVTYISSIVEANPTLHLDEIQQRLWKGLGCDG